MASSNWNLSKFRSEVLSGAGLSRTNRFEVVITPPPKLASSFSESYLSSLYVEQASLPLLNLTVKPLKIFGPSYQRPISSEYGGEGISLTFHVDREMKVRKFFENWMHIIVDPDTFTVGYQSDYIADVYIKQLDEQDNVTYEVKLIEAFPRSMNMLELNNGSTNQTHRLNIIFAYRNWINTSRQVQAQPLPRNVVNPQVPVVETDTRLRNDIITNYRLKNVLPTGQNDPGTTNEDMAFGINGLSG
jgi:hypothetical protein